MAGDWGKTQLPSGPSSICFDKDEFMKDNFNIDRFVSECRRRVPLETLREDLGLYLRLLRTAMIELINQDYADFVNLSGNLIGMDKAIGNILVPLGQLREEVLSVKSSVDETVRQIEAKLNRRKLIRDKKALLQQLITSIQCIERIENLLSIQSSIPDYIDSNYLHLFESSLDGNLMERVATEFNQLQFVVNKSARLQLVKNMKPRILQITTTLQHNLEGAFMSCLKSKDREHLKQCLRIYAAIDKTRDAEELFCNKIVAPYMESVISEKTLKSNSHGLKVMYAKVLEFIPKHCSDLKTVTQSAFGEESDSGFDFLVNSVWPEIVNGIQIHVPMLCDLTNPIAFHEQYLVSMEFLDRFEENCESLSSITKLREHDSYAAFMSKWNLAVYFQIRFQEIAGKLESCLDNMEVYTESSDYFLPQTRTLWECLLTCWLPDTHLRPLTYRFWKLSLLLLARYTSWISDTFCAQSPSMEQLKESNGSLSLLNLVENCNDKPINGLTEKSGTEDASEISLNRIVALANDIERLLQNIPSYLKDVVEPHMENIEPSKRVLLNDCIEEVNQVLSSSIPKLGQIVITAISSQCYGSLKLVYDIPRLFRKTNREVPNKPSGYVTVTLKPILIFLDEHEFVSSVRKDEWSSTIVENITANYLSVTSDVLTSVKKMEDSLKRLKKARDKVPTASVGGTSGMSDDDKIRLQLVLDVAFYKKIVESIGIDFTSCASLRKLEELVVSARASPGSAS